jgi:hypothetical protein
MYYVLFPYSHIPVGQEFIRRHIRMAMWSFVPPFRDAKFYGVPSGVFDKLESATGEK